MSKVQEFINSGILEEYCRGLLLPGEIQEVERMAGLYPAVQQAIDRIARTLTRPIVPEERLKNRILNTLDQLGEPPVFDLNHLPLINAYSDAEQWQRTVASIQPTREFRNLYVHPLQAGSGIEQFLLWVKEDVKPEDHHDERESFLILEGECECQIGLETIRLRAGDYVDIPLDTEHTVRVLSPEPVKAIVQRVK
ncbi:cupin domain-containing protein [Larkinella humicola]|uniref:Cupin domain-containing protein n=1 Tax=Larkinella humicola TaxID=2607654 RepID=A0A5N1JBV5_9BACT|nr:cupin domain-containing protein [Larkinella humicola]KAA9352764.1 cupin domain-containing protein [Larkinella humicola]